MIEKVRQNQCSNHEFIRKKPLPYDLSNFTVLIVEDLLHMQSLMAQMLKASASATSLPVKAQRKRLNCSPFFRHPRKAAI